MKIKKFIIYLLLTLLACLFVACGEPVNSETTQASSETESPSASNDLILFENGEFNFTLIRPEYADDDSIDAAMNLRNYLEKTTSVKIKFTDDYIPKGEEHDPAKYEILFGQTNYEESASLYEDLSYGEYRIAVVGNKIVIAAIDASASKKAAYAFAYHVETSFKDGKAVIEKDYYSEGVSDNLLRTVPAFNFGKYYMGYTGACSEKGFVYKNTSPDNITAYIDKAKAEGYTLHSSYTMGENISAVLTKDKAIVNLFYNEADKKTRVIIDNDQNTSYPLEEKEYEKTCSSLLVQLGLEPSDSNYLTTSAPTYSNGMGYIYRLADGSFIIIDGGFNTADNATLIYDTLCELAPDKNNIVIAAWIITHQHVDHIGAMDKFTSMYASKVKLELAIYNFPTTAECGTIINGNPYNADRFYQYIKNYPGVKSIIAHPGQYYNIRNAKIEMLHTIDLMRGDVKMEDSNSVCLMFRIEIEGQTFLFPADSYQDMTTVLVKNYGSYLKSDFCQLIHHGGTGGSNAFYKAVDPTIVLWPVGAWYYYPTFRYHDFNKYIFESSNVKEIILAASTNRTIELPYAYPTERILPPEITVTWK